ncbi:MAG: putative molybdenum carrier protein [Actinomycetota bacterium]|nr:putative molybdenum carrier protein [Actinomycetota bacterium]
MTGGQTGIDSIALDESSRVGLPTHAILPMGLRREDGVADRVELERGGAVRVHELGSSSFRYRTWASVYTADVVVLLDPASGEGSRETRIAARHFNRPLLDLTDMSITTDELVNWLLRESARVVLVAGNRASLLEQSADFAQATRERIQGVIEGICNVNSQRYGQAGVIASLAESERLAVPARLNGIPHVKSAIDLLAPVEIFNLSARDCARALALGVVDTAITWPSLLDLGTSDTTIRSLGAFPIHYGVLPRLQMSAIIPKTYVVQYREAFWGQMSEPEELMVVAVNDGNSEEWLRAGVADAAFDTYRTGSSATRYGLHDFFPAHWESVSILQSTKG